MPESAVRKLLANFLFLILAANGIACACPTAAANDGHNDHGAHVADDTTLGQCHDADCDGDCDSLSGKQLREQPAVATVVRGADDLPDSPALTRNFPIHDFRQSPDIEPPDPGIDRRQFVRATPVSRRDRMLN